jgi:hypothetical protein
MDQNIEKNFIRVFVLVCLFSWYDHFKYHKIRRAAPCFGTRRTLRASVVKVLHVSCIDFKVAITVQSSW